MMNLPEDFRNRMREQLGGDYEAFIKSYDMPPAKALRMNRRKIPSVDYARVCGFFAKAGECERVSHWPGAFYYTDSRPGQSPLHAAGAYYIQEASAMLPVTLLDIGERPLKVLDLCAAPGGKSTQIADLMDGRGLLVANEPVANRLAILSENIERMGVVNSLLTGEDPAKLAERFPAYFDRILVDAPCSGEGMFRKNPEAVNEWSPENVQMCAKRQDMILDCAEAMLAPGGRIVYSTCTFSYEEDEGAVERFIKRHPGYRTADGPHRIYPHTHKGEGHFAVALERIKDSGYENAGYEINGASAGKKSGNASKKPALNPVESALLCQFLGETLDNNSAIKAVINKEKDRLVRFGDSLYLAPHPMPDIKGLKVVRAGLKIGTFKKNRFEPDHALSHALCINDAVISIDLDPDSKEIRDFVTGLSIPCDKEMKGWCLVCTLGLPIGWGKAGGGTVKNHYPKGLRQASVSSSE